MALGIVLLAIGIPVWFPESFARGLRLWSIVIHSAAAVAAILSLVIHVNMAIFVTKGAPPGALFKQDDLDWDAIKVLRDRWPGKLLLKGVLHPGDAEQALALGADGVVVSNHGGRALDSSVATLDADLKRRQAELIERERTLKQEWQRKETAKLREMEQRLEQVLAKFESDSQVTIEKIREAAESRKAADQAQRQVARLRREAREDFQTTVIATAAGVPAPESNSARLSPDQTSPCTTRAMPKSMRYA